MPLAQANIIRYEELRSIAYTSISGSFAGVGTPFSNPVRMLKITNRTDADLIISFDGLTNHDILPAMSAYIYDYCTNESEAGGLLEQPAMTRVYIMQASGAPTLGTVYVTVIYASDI